MTDRAWEKTDPEEIWPHANQYAPNDPASDVPRYYGLDAIARALNLPNRADRHIAGLEDRHGRLTAEGYRALEIEVGAKRAARHRADQAAFWSRADRARDNRPRRVR